MTQGAIDLVQAHLEPAAAPLQLGTACAAPRLLHAAAAAKPVTPPAPRPLQRYRWVDAGNTVRVEVPVEQMGLRGGGATVTCTLQPERLELLVVPGSSQAPDSSQQALGSGGSVGSAEQAPTCRLLVHPLQTAVLPARCRCYPRGLLALPPGSTTSSGERDTGAEQPGGTAAGPQPASHGDEPAGSDSSSQLHCISFALPPGATELVVELAKAGGQAPWDALQARLPLAPSNAAGGGGGQPDLLALRCGCGWEVGSSDGSSDGSRMQEVRLGSLPPPLPPHLAGRRCGSS